MTVLYHYCPMSSFLKIIESSFIHCSNLSLANDPNEITLAQNEVICDFLNKVAGLQPYLRNNSHEFFALSFSRKKDLLSQWRGYGDMGKGVMLEIDIDVLKACNYLFNQLPSNTHILNNSLFETPVFEVSDIIYHKNEFKEKLQKTYRDFDDGKLKNSLENFDVENIQLINFINRVNNLCASYKASFYEEEKEVRCVIYSDLSNSEYKRIELRGEKCGEPLEQKVIFLDIQGKLSPRFPLRLKFNNLIALKSVMLGPANPNIADMVKVVLQNNGFSETDVTVSAGYFQAPTF
jgi:hypothetical protein